MKLYMFRTVRLSIIRSLFTVHSAMVYVIQVCRGLSSRTRMELQFHPGPARKLSTNMYDIYHCLWNSVPSWSCSKAVYKPVWHIPLLMELSSILVLLESCLQTCMTYTIAECTVNKLLKIWQTNCPKNVVSRQNKIVRLVNLFGFITKKLIFLSLTLMQFNLTHAIISYL